MKLHVVAGILLCSWVHFLNAGQDNRLNSSIIAQMRNIQLYERHTPEDFIKTHLKDTKSDENNQDSENESVGAVSPQPEPYDFKRKESFVVDTLCLPSSASSASIYEFDGTSPLRGSTSEHPVPTPEKRQDLSPKRLHPVKTPTPPNKN